MWQGHILLRFVCLSLKSRQLILRKFQGSSILTIIFQCTCKNFLIDLPRQNSAYNWFWAMRGVMTQLSQWKEGEVIRPTVGNIQLKRVWEAQSDQRHSSIQVSANSEKLILNGKSLPHQYWDVSWTYGYCSKPYRRWHGPQSTGASGWCMFKSFMCSCFVTLLEFSQAYSWRWRTICDS